MTNAITSYKQKLGGLQKVVTEQYWRDLVRAAGNTLDPNRVASVVINALRRNDKLLNVAASNPASFLGAMLESTEMGLLANGKEAALVSYGQEIQFQPMFEGLLHLAWRSDKLSSIECEVVRQQDSFAFERGSGAFVKHQPHWPIAEAGEIVAAYAVVWMKGGDRPIIEVMPVDEIHKHRAISRSWKRRDGSVNPSSPWERHFDRMCCKTVLKRICKRLPLTYELQRAIQLDDAAEVGKPQDLRQVEHVTLPELPDLTDAEEAAKDDFVQWFDQCDDAEAASRQWETVPEKLRPWVESSYKAAVQRLTHKEN